MKSKSLELLACPVCHARLDFHGDNRDPIESGRLICSSCQKIYFVEHGFAHFVQPKELTGFNRRFAHLYNYFSWIYRAFSKIVFAYLGMSEEKGRREILDRLEPGGGRVLEISIGPGVNLPYLIQRTDVGEVYGLDISLGQLKRCQGYTRRKGWQVDLFLGNAEQLPFQDNSFESVFHVGGINFFKDKKAAIKEMIRVAKPGMHILIADETERGARGYERTLPGIRSSFDGKRNAIVPPIDLVPGGKLETHLFDVWKDWFYCLEFSKP